MRPADSNAQLAWDLAAGIRPANEILDLYGLEPHEFRELVSGSEEFRTRIKEARKAWLSVTNARQRLAAKATYILEDALLTYANIIDDADLNPNVRLAAMKDLQNIAKIDDVREGHGPTIPSFKLVFNYSGGVQEEVSISGPQQKVIEGEIDE